MSDHYPDAGNMVNCYHPEIEALRGKANRLQADLDMAMDIMADMARQLADLGVMPDQRRAVVMSTRTVQPRLATVMLGQDVNTNNQWISPQAMDAWAEEHLK